MSSIKNDDEEPSLKEYFFEKRLGSGTYATVYKAHHKTKKNEVFAIKCIKRNSLNEISTENLIREIEILKNIKHDFIVQLIDFQWDSHYIYLIMEYCAGGDLSTFIRSRRTIPEKYVRRFVQQIACALKHLHSMRIAHMDLKPQNILLTSVNNPSLKLGDFGFAQKLKGKVGNSLRGSPLYMAPEILKFKVYDSKVDLWSVGVILFEVIFGYAPFISNSFEELEKKILDEKQIQIPGHVMLSETCKDLLKRLLQRNPNDRISFEQFFAHPFIDLEHMPSADSIKKATELLKKAVEADEKKDYEFAQKVYLRSLEYIIPAIQYETNYQKKTELREKAKCYLKRAEELAQLINPPSQPTTPTGDANISRPNLSNIQINSITPNPESPRESINNKTLNYSSNIFNSTVTRLTSASQVVENQTEKLIQIFANNQEILEAIKACILLETRTSNNEKFDTLLNEYQKSIAILLEHLGMLPKDSEQSYLLKKHINKWLKRAETIKEKLMFQTTQLEVEELKNDDESTVMKQCVVQ